MLLLLALALAAPAPAPSPPAQPAPQETLAVLAVADAPGPGPELAEMAHQLRAACRDRAAAVLEVPEMRARLVGQGSAATLAELERAYVGALATCASGEHESGARTLRGIVADLERLPEGPEAYAQWIRAQLRLAVVELGLGRADAYREALERVAAVEPRHALDRDLFSPSFRRDFEAARVRVAARPRRTLTVTVDGARAPTVFVDGRPSGVAPVALELPAGRYRVGASADALRVPSAWVDLREGDAAVALDFALAEAVRPGAGPGLSVDAAARGPALARAGGWLDVDLLLAASVARDGGAEFLVGALHDVRRGALLREGRVRMTAGAASPAHVAALAAFLVSGQPARGVVVSTPDLSVRAEGASLDLKTEAPRRQAWMRRGAWTSGGVAVALGALALQQGLAARGADREADGLLRADGTFRAEADSARHAALRADADDARRNALLAAGGSALLAATAGVLGYLSWDAGAPAVRF